MRMADSCPLFPVYVGAFICAEGDHKETVPGQYSILSNESLRERKLK